jgi:hypothetical protein
MTLTFKSSRPEERVIIERDKTGRQRVCRAVQSDYNTKLWNLRLDHPSGETWSGTFHGDGNTVNLAMTQMMMDKERDYLDDKARGDKPRAPDRDLNVKVDEFGRDIGAPVRSYLER